MLKKPEECKNYPCVKFQIYVKSCQNYFKMYKNIKSLCARQFIKVICFAGMQVLICKCKAKSLLQLYINSIARFPQVYFYVDNRQIWVLFI